MLKVHTDKPHLVSMGSGRLSTAVTILPLKHGELIKIGPRRDKTCHRGFPTK